jgi:hypothetical protein
LRVFLQNKKKTKDVYPQLDQKQKLFLNEESTALPKIFKKIAESSQTIQSTFSTFSSIHF